MAQAFAITSALLTSLLVVGAFYTISVLSGATGEAPRVSGGWRVGRARRADFRLKVIAKESARVSARVAKKGGARIARDGDADVGIVLRLAPALSAEDAEVLREWARSKRPPRAKSAWAKPWFILRKLTTDPPKIRSLARYYSAVASQLLDYVGRGAAAGILFVALYWFFGGGPPDDPSETLNLVALVSFSFATLGLSAWLARKLDELLPDRLAALLLVVILTGFFYLVGNSTWDR